MHYKRKLVFAFTFAAVLLMGAAAVWAQETTPAPTLSGLEGGTMGIAEANGIEIVYESFGPESGETIFFISGTGSQLIEWPIELINALVEEGYQVITYDNRNTGLSTKLEEAGPPDWTAIFTALGAGEPVPVAYTAEDMALDAVGLLDALDIPAAHVVGASGGAIIAPVLAANYPERVQSLTLIAANSGNPAYPIPANPERIANIPPALPPGSPIEDIIEQRLIAAQTLSSPAYPTDEGTLREWVRRAVERSYYPVGSDRQGAAVLAVLPQMPEILQSIDVPTVVIHGKDDPLNAYQLGEDVANLIPNAGFTLIDGMGHDIPVQLVPVIAEEILEVARTAE